MNSFKNMIRNYQEKRRKISAAVEQELFWRSIPRQVAPSAIEEYPEYIRINYETYVKCLIVGVPRMKVEGYPRNMNIKIIDELLNISTKGYTLGISFAAIPIATEQAMQMLDHALFYNKVNQEEATKLNEGQKNTKLSLDAEDFNTNYRELHQNNMKMYHTAFIIAIWAKSESEIRTAESHVKTVLESNIVKYEVPYFRQLETFIAAQPYPTSADFAWVELFSWHVAALAATRNPNSRTSVNGLYFGDDKKTGRNVLLDLKALAAQHLTFIGPTGSGKTFTLLMLLMRAHDMLGKRIIYTTPKADVTTNYRAVADYYGESASIIDIGPSGKNINPLQVMIDEASLGNDYRAYIRAFDDHMELVDQFFKVLFEGTKSMNMGQYINESMIEAYKRKGIYRENPESWKSTKEWPTLLDIRKVWEEDAQNPANVTAKALVDKTFMINTSWSYMNRPTDVNTSADFIVVDISDVPASLQDAMNVFVTGIMGMRFRTDTKKETIIATDEAAVFLRNPQLALFLLKTLTQGRSYNIALWLSTQQTADLIKAGVSEEFKTNIYISIILGNMRPDSLEHVRTFYKLNETDIMNLKGCGVGEGLILVGNEVIPTKFLPTPHEMEVIKGRRLSKNKPVNECGCTDNLIDSYLLELATKYQAYFEDWFPNGSDMLTGYEQRMVQRATSRGSVRMWIKSSIIKDEMIGMESIDHYSTVLQTVAYLKAMGIDAEINYNDVDIVASFKSGKVAFEYERPGSHTEIELIKKKQYAETTYGRCFFIGTVENLKLLEKSVGTENVVRRGVQLAELIADLNTEKTA